MKSIMLLVLLWFSSFICQAQSEFKQYPNGLIYSEEAMTKLSHVVDSLNLKFKRCERKKYYAPSQALAYIVSLDTGDVLAARHDMESQMPVETFMKKYPLAKIRAHTLIIRDKYTKYNGKKVVRFEEMNLSDGYGYSISSENMELYDKDLQNEWIVDYRAKTEYSKESVNGFYFPEKFVAPELPEKYALMIGYADCLIDTSVNKFKKNVKKGHVAMPESWTALSMKKKRKLLEEMRGIRVVGMCSMDQSPRYHAMNIALLSAETYNWSVFLKAHLDIMNDHFDRMTDGSYAWGQRETYIKELEVLNINVPDLIFGISLGINNPAINHYSGDIGRIGRALAETTNAAQIESEMLTTIADPKLDDYNRLLFYFLFSNYNYFLKDEAAKKVNAERLKEVVNALPKYYRDAILTKK